MSWQDQRRLMGRPLPIEAAGRGDMRKPPSRGSNRAQGLLPRRPRATAADDAGGRRGGDESPHGRSEAGSAGVQDRQRKEAGEWGENEGWGRGIGGDLCWCLLVGLHKYLAFLRCL